MRETIFLNGRFVKGAGARISVFNRGFLYGEGIFETMRCYDGAIFKLDEHIERLFSSLKLVHLKSPYTKKALKNYIYLSLKKNFLKDAYVRVALWRKEESFGLDFKSSQAEIVIITRPIKKLQKGLYKKGLSATLVKNIKNADSVICNIKSFNYLENTLVRKNARSLGFDDAILTNTKGLVSEASSSNIFIIKNNVLITPPLKSGLLCGITRAVVFDIAKRYFLDVQERSIKPGELLNSDEAFLTYSVMEIIPLVKVDKKRIGSGVPGELTKLLAILYRLEAKKQTQRAEIKGN